MTTPEVVIGAALLSLFVSFTRHARVHDAGDRPRHVRDQLRRDRRPLAPDRLRPQPRGGGAGPRRPAADDVPDRDAAAARPRHPRRGAARLRALDRRLRDLRLQRRARRSPSRCSSSAPPSAGSRFRSTRWRRCCSSSRCSRWCSSPGSSAGPRSWPRSAPTTRTIRLALGARHATGPARPAPLRERSPAADRRRAGRRRRRGDRGREPVHRGDDRDGRRGLAPSSSTPRSPPPARRSRAGRRPRRSSAARCSTRSPGACATVRRSWPRR